MFLFQLLKVASYVYAASSVLALLLAILATSTGSLGSAYFFGFLRAAFIAFSAFLIYITQDI
jgi:hypothetical protein